MNILLVHNYYQRPGGEDVVFQMEAEMLRAHGHKVATYCRSNDDIHPDGSIAKLVLLKNVIWSAESHRDLTAVLRVSRPDVVHVHNTFALISPSIYSACASAGIPVVQTLHNYRMFCPAGTFFRDGHICEACLEEGMWRGVLHRCYRGSRLATAAAALTQATHHGLNTWDRGINRYIALTEFSHAKFIQAGIPSARIRVKPNFVHPDPGWRRGNGRYALFAGRLSAEKRPDMLLKSWSQLAEDIPLLIVGGGPELEALKIEAARRRLDSVRFLGQLPRSRTLAMMREASFLVFSSGWYENFPMVIAESFACGLPVLCPRLGVMQDLVTDHQTGLHYSAADAGELAEKAAWAWSHPTKMQAMGREARHEYDSKYTAEKNYPLLMNIYEEAIREGRTRPSH